MFSVRKNKISIRIVLTHANYIQHVQCMNKMFKALTTLANDV